MLQAHKTDWRESADIGQSKGHYLLSTKNQYYTKRDIEDISIKDIELFLSFT